MLAHRPPRCPNITPAVDQCLVFAEMPACPDYSNEMKQRVLNYYVILQGQSLDRILHIVVVIPDIELHDGYHVN